VHAHVLPYACIACWSCAHVYSRTCGAYPLVESLQVMGECPTHMAMMTAAYVSGFQNNSGARSADGPYLTAACCKHYGARGRPCGALCMPDRSFTHEHTLHFAPIASDLGT
jgi:hypothetical protein